MLTRENLDKLNSTDSESKVNAFLNKSQYSTVLLKDEPSRLIETRNNSIPHDTKSRHSVKSNHSIDVENLMAKLKKIESENNIIEGKIKDDEYHASNEMMKVKEKYNINPFEMDFDNDNIESYDIPTTSKKQKYKLVPETNNMSDNKKMLDKGKGKGKGKGNDIENKYPKKDKSKDTVETIYDLTGSETQMIYNGKTYNKTHVSNIIGKCFGVIKFRKSGSVGFYSIYKKMGPKHLMIKAMTGPPLIVGTAGIEWFYMIESTPIKLNESSKKTKEKKTNNDSSDSETSKDKKSKKKTSVDQISIASSRSRRSSRSRSSSKSKGKSKK